MRVRVGWGSGTGRLRDDVLVHDSDRADRIFVQEVEAAVMAVLDRGFVPVVDVSEAPDEDLAAMRAYLDSISTTEAILRGLLPLPGPGPRLVLKDEG